MVAADFGETAVTDYKKEVIELRDEVRRLRNENKTLKRMVDDMHATQSPTHMGEPLIRESVVDEQGYFLYGDAAIRYLRSKLEGAPANAAN